jgi:hypothetical protein
MLFFSIILGMLSVLIILLSCATWKLYLDLDRRVKDNKNTLSDVIKIVAQLAIVMFDEDDKDDESINAQRYEK